MVQNFVISLFFKCHEFQLRLMNGLLANWEKKNCQSEPSPSAQKGKEIRASRVPCGLHCKKEGCRRKMSFHLPTVEPTHDVWILCFHQRHRQSPYFIFSSEVLGIEHRASFRHAPSLSWVPRTNSDITFPKGDRVFGIDYYSWLVIVRRVRVTKTTSWGGYCYSISGGWISLLIVFFLV